MAVKKKSRTQISRVREWFTRNKDGSPSEAMSALGVSSYTVYTVRSRMVEEGLLKPLNTSSLVKKKGGKAASNGKKKAASNGKKKAVSNGKKLEITLPSVETNVTPVASMKRLSAQLACEIAEQSLRQQAELVGKLRMLISNIEQ